MEDNQKDKKKQDETGNGAQDLLDGNERVSQDQESVRELEEKENFHKLAIIILDVLPKYLRQLFKDKWDVIFPNNKWDFTTASGAFLLSQVPKGHKPMKYIANNVMKGDTGEWDPTTLFWVFLYSGLNLVAPCRVGGTIALPLLESEYIDMVREIRNTFFAHAPQASIKKDDFECIMLNLTTQTQFGGASLKTELEEIENSPIERELSMNLRQELEDQKKANNVLEDWLKNLDTRLDNVEKTSRENSEDVKNMKRTHAELSRSFEETSEIVKKFMKRPDEPRGVLQDIPNLKKWYQNECARHEVNCVVGDYIKPLLLDIKDFAVNLAVKIRAHERAPSQSYHDELDKHIESLKGHTETIEAGEMMNMVKDKDRSRIVFVGGVAGVGKSVLAKKLAFNWSSQVSTHEMYTHIECLLYFTCGRFNNFFAECDNEQMKPEIIIQEYLKKEFRSLPVNNDETTLFLIDGLDELQEPEKMIQTFIKQFSKARFIILGRPHSEHIFYSITERYQHLEILGLKDDQIQKYIQNFYKISTGVTGDHQTTEPEVNSFSELIKSTLEKSPNIFAIKTIPQFLNTICCDVMLTREDKVIANRTELYSWSLFLLMKQHFQGKESHNQKPTGGSGIFADYSQQLLQVSKQAFQLYNEGTIIFKKKDLELTDDAFIEEFLLGIKNKHGEVSQFMFKHLTVMEFFTAIYVYFAEDRKTLVNKLLENRHYQVVSFVCHFLRFSLVKQNLFEEDTVSYLLLKEIADGNQSETNYIHEMMRCKDAENLICGILDKVDDLQSADYPKGVSQMIVPIQRLANTIGLKMRFIAECFEQTDEVSDTSFLEKLLNTITPCSSCSVSLSPFGQLYLSSILSLASNNELEADIETIFNGLRFSIDDLKQADILSYWNWLDIFCLTLRNINHYTPHHSSSIHHNVAYCGAVTFFNCRVPPFPSCFTNPNSPTAKTTPIRVEKRGMKMKLTLLKMNDMEINQSDSAGAANLFGLAEEVELYRIQISGSVMKETLEKSIEMRPPRLKKIMLHSCPLVDPEIARKMEENGVKIIELSPRSVFILYEQESRDLVCQLNEKLGAKNYIAMNGGLVKFIRRSEHNPLVVIVFIQLDISNEVRKEILFAQKKEMRIVLVKLESDFHLSEALTSAFELNPCLDHTEEQNIDDRAFELNRTISAIIDHKFIVISNALDNQFAANEVKQKFADEIGCPVFVNIELRKYEPGVIVFLMTNEYEDSDQCEEMIYYALPTILTKVIAVKMDNDFQPGEELSEVIQKSTCICWNEQTNFHTNFAKVKEEINAKFGK